MPIRGLKATREEIARLQELLDKSFKGAEFDHRFIRLHQEKPIYDDFSRVFEYDPSVDSGLGINQKMLVAHVGIYPQSLRFGKSIIINGGIRDVASHPIARGKGYGKQVLLDARDFMFKNLIDISILFAGPWQFYDKCGWRGGMREKSYIMGSPEIKKLLEDKRVDLSNFKREDISIRFIQKSDFAQVSTLYNSSIEDQYYPAERSAEYWMNHFETRPERFWNYVVAETHGTLVGIFCFSLDQHENGVILNVLESACAPTICNPGSQAFTLIYQAFLTFIIEEALDEKKRLYQVLFKQSSANPIISHLKTLGYDLKEITHAHLGMMIAITNPYSLFNRFKPEFISRFIKGKLPSGEFWMEFDSDGRFPGGIKITSSFNRENSSQFTFDLTITNKKEEINTWKSRIIDGIEFRNIEDLALIIGYIVDIDEIIDSPNDFGINAMGNGLKWLKGLFSGLSVDFPRLDHF